MILVILYDSIEQFNVAIEDIDGIDNTDDIDNFDDTIQLFIYLYEVDVLCDKFNLYVNFYVIQLFYKIFIFLCDTIVFFVLGDIIQIYYFM